MRLASDDGLRAGLGAANRLRACAKYDLAAMLARYEAVYAGAMGGGF